MDSASPHPAQVMLAENVPPAAIPPDSTPLTLKRKRSPSVSNGTAPSAASLPPAAKATKTSGANQLSINYLVRQSDEDLPLINKDDTLPNLLSLLASYSSILDRHESIASNLGAKPLGPILIKRFERCFEKPPKVVASHHKGAAMAPDDTTHTISWYEVIEFARSHPAQFTLDTFSKGRRVCQFYYPQKQLRVQVSEEDFLFINSGRCQELIPPLPIWEDEEKEVGTCDVLEAKLKELTNAADMVAARTRQLGHRLKGRRAAILERRAEGGSGTPAKANALQATTAHPTSASNPVATSFTAVNTNTANGKPSSELNEPNLVSSMAVRNDLLRHFESLPHNQTQPRHQHRQSIASLQHPHHSDNPNHLASPGHHAASSTSSLSPVPAALFTADQPMYPTADHRPQATPSYNRPPSSGAAYAQSNANQSKHNFSRPLPPALESSQPFRPLCQAHMDSLPRGHRVLPPCDRCRRLRMDCVKNLTSCAGCTKKHARCHWRDVGREEVGALEGMMDAGFPETGYPDEGYGDMGGGYSNENGESYGIGPESEDDDSNPLEDLEALGEQEEQERADEEGMRNARELARQGWEQGLKVVQQNDTPNGEASVQSGDVAMHNDTVGGVAESAKESASGGTSENIQGGVNATATGEDRNNIAAASAAATLPDTQRVLTTDGAIVGTEADAKSQQTGALADSMPKDSGNEQAAATAKTEEKPRAFTSGFHAVNARAINDSTNGNSW